MKIIAVNAYPLHNSGGLSILEQLIRGIECYSQDCGYLLFVHPGVRVKTTAKNIRFVDVHQNPFDKKLFRWNFSGMKKWLDSHGITPDAVISMANVNSLIQPGIPNFLYFHQAIPLYPYRWNPFLSNQRVLWMYKTVFRFFVKRSLKPDTEVFVQLECIKNRFSNTFKTDKSRIHVITPEGMSEACPSTPSPMKVDPEYCNLIYPATPFLHKNHKVLIKALQILEKYKKFKINLYLTCTKVQVKDLCDLPLGDHGIRVTYLGYIHQEELKSLYRQVDALLFPSKIESFGLPLIEAASYGLPIAAADTDFAREVLCHYPGARFVPEDDPGLWAEQIAQLSHVKGERYEPLQIEQKHSWGKFFEIIHKSINKDV